MWMTCCCHSTSMGCADFLQPPRLLIDISYGTKRWYENGVEYESFNNWNMSKKIHSKIRTK